MAALSPHRERSGRYRERPRSLARRSSSRRSSRLAETPPAAAKVLAPVISTALKKFSVKQVTTAFR